MELLLLLLAVPFVWMLLLPVRVMGRERRLPVRSAGILALVVVGGILVVTTMKREAPPADYAAGDAALRAMLEQPR
jgi:hypothetical protein